jgi:hypothetical protein
MAFQKITFISVDDISSPRTEYSFPAMLETFGIGYEIQETSLGFSPLSFPTDKIRSRMLQTLEMSINVFSANRTESIANYDKLNGLLYAMKPRYLNIGGQYIPSSENTFGHLVIQFKGLPDIENNATQGSVTINCTQLKYEINKDLGFISSSPPERLIPVGFKITVGGRIITNLFDGMTRIDDDSPVSTIDSSIGEIISDTSGGTLEGFEQAFKDIFNYDAKSLVEIGIENPQLAYSIANFISNGVTNNQITFNSSTRKFTLSTPPHSSFSATYYKLYQQIVQVN